MAGFYQGERNPPEKTVYISNIPFDSKWQDMKDYFNNEVGGVSFCDIYNGSNGPKGTGVVTFKTGQKAKMAVSKCHRKEFEGRKLSIYMGKENEGPTPGFAGFSGSSAGDDYGRDRGSSNLYGLNIQFLSSLGVKGPLVAKVFVANLDYKVDEKQLREVFKLSGKVLEIDLLKDKDGKSKGMALVEFSHPVEAVQAISMFHQQTLFDRPMSVRMDALVNEEPHHQNTGRTKLPPGLKSIGMGLGTHGEPLKDVASGDFARTCTESYGFDGARETYNGYSREMGGRDGYSGARDGYNGHSYGNGRESYGSSYGSNGYTNGGSSFGPQGGRMDTIIVRNLPAYMDWTHLKEVFSQYGEILFCEIQGRSGSGIIKFATETQAGRAIKLADRQRLGTCMLDVTPYTANRY